MTQFIKYNNEYYQKLSSPQLLAHQDMIQFIVDSMQFEMPRIAEILRKEFPNLYLEREVKTNTSQNYLTLNNPSNQVYNPITVNLNKVRMTSDAYTDALRELIIKIMDRKPTIDDAIKLSTDEQGKKEIADMKEMMKKIQDTIDKMNTPKIPDRSEPIQSTPVETEEAHVHVEEIQLGELPPLETMEKTKEEF